MRVAALDLGKVRVGLAVSDELGALAHPRPPFDARNRKVLLDKIAAFAAEEQIERLVVGLALDANGEEGPAARKCITFAEQVAAVTGKPVDLWDERFTTVEAHRRLRAGGRDARSSRGRVDSAAACIMLQAWLDGYREREG